MVGDQTASFGSGVARFHDRQEGGRLLASLLAGHEGLEDALVLALPRGGVPVGYEVASALSLPLDIYVVRKLGLPGHEELALGAIASGGTRIWNRDLVARLGLPSSVLEGIVRRESKELERRETLYREGLAPLELEGRTIILVDDGLATGATMRAAIHALQKEEILRCIVAVPVAPPGTCLELSHLADEVVCPLQPQIFMAVGEFYDDFNQTTDEEVRELLARAAERANENPTPDEP